MQDRFAAKLINRAGSPYGFDEIGYLDKFSDAELHEYVDLVLELENGVELARLHRIFLKRNVNEDNDKSDEVDSKLETEADENKTRADKSEINSAEPDLTKSRIADYKRLLEFVRLADQDQTSD